MSGPSSGTTQLDRKIGPSIPDWARVVAASADWDVAMERIFSARPHSGHRILTIMREFYTAWRLVFGAGGWDRVLCFDVRLGTMALALARSCLHLSIVGFDPNMVHAAAVRLRSAGASNFDCNVLDPDGGQLPFPNEHFDAVVAEDLGATLAPDGISVGKRDRQPDWICRETHRVLNPSGIACFAFRRLLSYRAVLPEFSAHSRSRSFFSRRIRQSLVEAGFSSPTVYPMILDRDWVRQIVLEDPYTATPAFRLRGNLKAYLLGRTLGRAATPGVAIVARKDQAPPRFFDNLLEDLKQVGALTPKTGDRAVVRRFYVNASNAILTVGRRGEQHGECVVVLPSSRDSLERRSREAAILYKLDMADLPISPFVPKPLGEGAIDGQQYLVLSEIRGIAGSGGMRRTKEMTRRATAILTAFHSSTARQRVVDDALFNRLIAQPLNIVERQLGPESRHTLGKIGHAMRERLWDRSLPTVWTHGDYKIENVLFDRRSLAVRGVIDWDLSQEEGLPLLDLLYLIVYNRTVAEHQRIEPVVLNTVLPAAFTAEESDLCAGYTRALGLRPEHVESLRPFFWIHGIAYRLRILQQAHDVVARWLAVSEAVAERLNDRA